MRLLRRVSSLTLRHIVILIILLVVLLNTAKGADNRLRWVYDLFRASVEIQIFEDGSGVAVGAEGETIHFCIDGEPCGEPCGGHEQRLRTDAPRRMMRIGENGDEIVTVTRRTN